MTGDELEILMHPLAHIASLTIFYVAGYFIGRLHGRAIRDRRRAKKAPETRNQG